MDVCKECGWARAPVRCNFEAYGFTGEDAGRTCTWHPNGKTVRISWRMYDLPETVKGLLRKKEVALHLLDHTCSDPVRCGNECRGACRKLPRHAAVLSERVTEKRHALDRRGGYIEPRNMLLDSHIDGFYVSKNHQDHTIWYDLVRMVCGPELGSSNLVVAPWWITDGPEKDLSDNIIRILL